MATFFCQATGVNAYWLIKGETVPANGDDDFKGRGWIFEEAIDLDTDGARSNVHNLTLKVPSDIDNNNTEIRCAGVIHAPAVSDTAFLIIKGILK